VVEANCKSEENQETRKGVKAESSLRNAASTRNRPATATLVRTHQKMKPANPPIFSVLSVYSVLTLLNFMRGRKNFNKVGTEEEKRTPENCVFTSRRLPVADH
jgi:hypothetical protein